MLAGDRAAMTGDGNEAFQSGTSEIKNWIAACGILEDSGLDMTLAGLCALLPVRGGNRHRDGVCNLDIGPADP